MLLVNSLIRYCVKHHRTSCQILGMNKLHQHPNCACRRLKTIPQINSRKSKPYNPSLPLSMNLQNIKTHPLTSLIPLLERISPCSTSMTNPNAFLPNEEPDTHRDHDLNMKTKMLLQRIGLKDPELDPRSHRGHRGSEPLTNHFSPGSRLNQMKTFSSPPAKNSLGKWSKTMPLTSNSRNFEFSVLNESPNFPTWSGTISLPENLSTSTSSSLGCTQPQPTTEQLKTSASSNSISVLINQPNPSKLIWRIAYWATKFIFLHCEKELEEYTKYISSYFASLHPSAHWKVFELDKAIRKQVGSVNDVSLNEFSKF